MDEQRNPDQWWYWTPQWQAGEQEAKAETARSEGEHFTNGEEFLASLRPNTTNG